MANSTISLDRIKTLVNYTIDNNIKLQEKGKFPIALGFIADAGIGKTSTVRQVAEERGMTLTKLNLSQLEESGDLLGFPQIEYECQVGQLYKNEKGETKVKVLPETVWLNAKQMDSPQSGCKYRQTGKTRMGYAKPAWVPEYNEKGCLLLLDDYSRANPTILQSVMEIILEQGYVSWHLPKKTTIVLTANPDNGMYNVNSGDEAQNGRYVGFDVEWDRDAWAEWAEGADVDGRCINFVMSYSEELFNKDADGNRICNPRSFVMFADMISGIDNWDDPKNMEFIHTIAKGCFKDEGGRFAAMFSSFIRNKMHLLIQPKELLSGKWNDVKEKLQKTLYDSDGQYRPDISALLERRFANYVNAWLESDEKTPIKTVVDRINDFISLGLTPTTGCAFTKDQIQHMVKTITSKHRGQTNKLLYEPAIAAALT